MTKVRAGELEVARVVKEVLGLRLKGWAESGDSRDWGRGWHVDWGGVVLGLDWDWVVLGGGRRGGLWGRSVLGSPPGGGGRGGVLVRLGDPEADSWAGCRGREGGSEWMREGGK